ncbi:septation protein SpoVG family protein [bacterium]|nr:septation protein SpoVG family protein [bacterium]
MKPEITDVNIYPYKYKKGDFEIMAFVDITIEKTLTIRGIRILRTKENGYFLSFPTQKYHGEYIKTIDYEDGKYERYLRRKILDKYKSEVGDYHGT